MLKYRVFWKDGTCSIVPAASDAMIVAGIEALTLMNIHDVVERLEDVETDQQLVF